MTEYFDNLTAGRTITVTTGSGIFSGTIKSKSEDGNRVFVGEDRRGSMEFTLQLDAGPTSQDDERDWTEMEWTATHEGETMTVVDIRQGHFDTNNENPNGVRDDLPKTDPGHPDFDWNEEFERQDYWQ